MDNNRLRDILQRNDKGSLPAFINSDPDLCKFEDGMMKLGNYAARVPRGSLSSWIWSKRAELGIDHAIELLDRFVTSTGIPGYEYIVIQGLKIDAAFDLSKEISVLPFWALPETFSKQHCANVLKEHDPSSRLLSELVVIRKSSLSNPKFLLSDEEAKQVRSKVLFISAKRELVDAAQCLTVLGPSSPTIVADTLWYPEDWIPCIPHGSGFALTISDLRNLFIYHLTEEDKTKARNIYEAYSKLPTNTKTKLQVCLDRLNRASCRISNVDIAIELGIAMEAVFLNDVSNDGEYTFRLRLRAARLLGEDRQSRQRVFILFRDLYKCRSQAVHTGRVDDTINKNSTTEVLREGRSLVARAIEMIIQNGWPDWDDIVLG